MDNSPGMMIQGLRAQPVIGSTDVNVMWEKPEESQSSSIYKVMRREVGAEGAKWTTVMQEKDIFTAVVSRLKPFTRYEFRVQVLGIVTGLGPMSEPVVAMTNPAAPGDPPTNVRVSSVTTDSITITWDPPTHTHSPLTSYHLFFDQEEQDDYVEAILTANTFSYTALYLFPNTEYRFQIYASTAAGDGPHSELLICSTRPSVAIATSSSSSSASDTRPVCTRAGSISGRAQVKVSVQYDEDKQATNLKQTGSFSAVAPMVKAKPRLATIRDVDEKEEPHHTSSNQSNVSDERITTNTTETSGEDNNMHAVLKSAERKESLFSVVAPNSSRTSFSEPMDYQKLERLQARFEKQIDPARDTMTADQLLNGVSDKQDVDIKVGPDDILINVKSASKTIRGKRNGVRSKLEVYNGYGDRMNDDQLAKLFEEERDGSIVVYISSVEIIRETSARCQDIKKLFHNMRVKVMLKDISLDANIATEFKKRCGDASVVPQVFVNGAFLGDYNKVMQMNEEGELRNVLKGFEEAPMEACATCGGRGFVNCSWCQGSKKSIHNPFSRDFEKNALKCTVCNEIGLMRCPQC
eukprot:m.104390 g.104390  ORF g.104390 m.104390 type:complete len:579 (-) comp9111_c2_seq9:46-1782(-)